MEHYTSLSPHEFRKLLAKAENSIVLDIRSLDKTKLNRGIYGAKRMDFLSGTFEADIKKCDKACPVFIYCQDGQQSERACQFMEKAGFKYMYHLEGGLDAYEKAFSQTAGEEV